MTNETELIIMLAALGWASSVVGWTMAVSGIYAVKRWRDAVECQAREIHRLRGRL